MLQETEGIFLSKLVRGNMLSGNQELNLKMIWVQINLLILGKIVPVASLYWNMLPS